MQQIARSFALAFNHLPRPYRFMVESLTIVTLTVAVWRPHSCFSVIEQPNSCIIPSEKHQWHELALEASEPFDQISPDSDEDIPKDELNERAEGEVGVHEYIVSTGDTLSSILTQYGINIANITALSRQNPALHNLKIGQSLSWALVADGDLQRLTWDVSRRETRIYNRIDGIFRERIVNMTGEWRNTTLTGQLDGSFITSAHAAGLTENDINTAIKALQWQLDFRKLRKGDQFSVLTLREMLDRKNAQSQLLGVHLRSGGKDYYAFRADDGKFYNRDAAGLARGFMRFPTVKQFRVSSNFNPRRINPVTGRIAPHHGVDFAVPIGTPVLAVGDGEVMVSKRDGVAGNYVAIRHTRQYMTRYMHLKKLLVKPGQKVQRGDRIALSGNTGRSTGPHLHYEVWINQKAVNPLTAKLPRTEILTGRYRTEYLAQVKQMLPQLQLN
ncbi:murein DD-endopeptidase MepM [Candidatus Doolittlea endobia]|uniref:Murein DD-endopeptidase MepM n=1 Tax=Candidatus Doolittlea endobia TaxID=1778262 RepID=A0A143WSI6_9ENTR|nr:murein DD-endopeptidase MepM [Candidatus Doolittlea endobia]CUX96715.1 Murein DD-endopeptidase MepM [Candidatus Doolittlea endobia]